MTPIEQKRKELEDKISNIKPYSANVLTGTIFENYIEKFKQDKAKVELEMFNLGVEMARKEILKIISETDFSLLNAEEYILEELKQKLGEDKT